jgi:hypothetical protein
MSDPALHGYLPVATIPVMIMKRSWIAILTLLTQLVDQHAQRTIEYLKEENKILYHKLGKKRLILTDQERRRLAEMAPSHGLEIITSVPSSIVKKQLRSSQAIFHRFDGRLTSTDGTEHGRGIASGPITIFLTFFSFFISHFAVAAGDK